LYIYALDLGLTRDRTARAIVHLDTKSGKVVLDDLKVWQGSKEEPVNIFDVEEDIRASSKRFMIRKIVCDPWQMQSTIQKLEGAYPIEEFTFTTENVRRLSENLYSLLHNGQLVLYPDEALENELLRLSAKSTSYGWRIDHKSGEYSDRAIALGMAALEVMREPPYEPRIRILEW
jgi:phage terminase large subunit-like protein